MSVLSWDKPERTRDIEEWKADQADSAPPGTYQPNMSDEDNKKWKAKITGKKRGYLQVEIRKSLRGTQMVIIVGLDGYAYKHLSRDGDPRRYSNTVTRGLNIHMALNGGLQMTFDEWAEMQEAVTEAAVKLRELASSDG